MSTLSLILMIGWGSDMNDDATREALGRTIQSLRSRLGLKRRDLAEAAGLSYAYLSEIENGKKVPSTKVLANLALALEMPAHDLLRLTDELEVEVRAERGTYRPEMPSRAAAVGTERRMPSPWFHDRPPPADPLLADAEGPDPALVRELTETARRLEHRDLQTLVALARRLAGR